jgi:hypothetical protein
MRMKHMSVEDPEGSRLAATILRNHLELAEKKHDKLATAGVKTVVLP